MTPPNVFHRFTVIVPYVKQRKKLHNSTHATHTHEQLLNSSDTLHAMRQTSEEWNSAVTLLLDLFGAETVADQNLDARLSVAGVAMLQQNA